MPNDNDKPKITAIQGNGQQDKMAEMIRTLEAGMTQQIKFIDLRAQLIKAQYDSLIKQGFTEAQSIELCKSLW